MIAATSARIGNRAGGRRGYSCRGRSTSRFHGPPLWRPSWRCAGPRPRSFPPHDSFVDGAKPTKLTQRSCDLDHRIVLADVLEIVRSQRKTLNGQQQLFHGGPRMMMISFMKSPFTEFNSNRVMLSDLFL